MREQEWHEWWTAEFAKRALTVEAATLEDIQALESHDATELPAAYRAFLMVAGRGCESLWDDGVVAYFPGLADIASIADDITKGLEEGKPLGGMDAGFRLPDGATVITMNQGYAFLFLAAGEDPEVFSYVEGESEATLVAPAFSEMVLDLITVR